MKKRRIEKETHRSLTDPEAAAVRGGALFPAHTDPALGGLIFKHPFHVVAAPYLTHDDKRAILASWASDVWAVISKPALRDFPASEGPVPVAEVLAALRDLDGQAIDVPGAAAADRGPESVGQVSSRRRRRAEGTH